MKKFSYSKWAKAVIAECMQSDLDCGFDVANDTPDPEKARAAVQDIINQFRREGYIESAKTQPANVPMSRD